ncbi:hypothetical protein F5887DRAFT_1159444 [Amanita rubescens]|nr:hypothetical protein F5887DRAFT_1159444 [Amanita rubescens]
MHAITSFIATIGAGRQSKHTPSLNIDAADAITGLLHVQVAQSSVLEEKETRDHPSASKDGWLATTAVFKKWKKQIAGKITRDKRSVLPDADAERMQKLLHHAAFLVASLEANEKARQELKASTANFCTSEQFDAMFPPNVRYISKAWEEEISEKVWEELDPRPRCPSPAPFARRVKTALAFGTTPDSDGGMGNKICLLHLAVSNRAWGERKQINELDLWQWGTGTRSFEEVERGMDIRCSEPSFGRI